MFKRATHLFKASPLLLQKNVNQALFQGLQATSNMEPRKLKPSTGLVGVPVQPRWRDVMLKLIDNVLHELNTLPKDVYWRVAHENNFNFFRRTVQENDDYEKVEEIINRGQVEELILQFEDMMTLIPKMRDWQPWQITAQNVDAEKRFVANGEDPMMPSNYVSPLTTRTFNTWSGKYNVEWTEEELQKQKEEAQAKAAAAAAAAAAPKK